MPPSLLPCLYFLIILLSPLSFLLPFGLHVSFLVFSFPISILTLLPSYLFCLSSFLIPIHYFLCHCSFVLLCSLHISLFIFLLSNTLLSPLPPCLLPCLLLFAFSVSFLAFILYTVLRTFYFPTSSTVSSLFPSFCTHFLPPCIVPFLNSFPLFICPTTYLSYPPFSLLYPSLTPLLSLLCPVFFLLIPSVLFSFPPSSCLTSPCCLCLVSFFFSWPFLHPCLLPFSLLAVSISLLSSSFISSVLLSLPHLLISFPQLPSSVLS